MNKVFMIPEISKKISLLVGEYENDKRLKLLADNELLNYFHASYPVVFDVLEGNNSYCLVRANKKHIVDDSIRVENVVVSFITKDVLKHQITNQVAELQNQQTLLLSLLNRF